ncbi:MAG: PsbP-related protein [Cyanobacteria bacterium P01_C01_bin.72]
MKSTVGKILYDRYRLVQQLSQNDWSTVYLAEDLAFNHVSDNKTRCKIEQLQPQYDHEILGRQSWQKVLQIFMAQGEIMQKVSQHSQIPQLLAFFECDREFYLVREYIPGKTLAETLRNNLLNEGEAIVWLQEILSALEQVHQLGVAHLNIQPESLKEDQGGRKFLTEFAAVKSALWQTSQTSKKIFNPGFAPNSQQSHSQQSKADAYSDIYALGKTIIYALTGEFSESIQADNDQVDSEQLTHPNNSPTANIRPDLVKVLNKMVACPADCYQSATEVLEDLDFSHNVVTFPPPFRRSNNVSQSSRHRSKLASNSSKSSSSNLVRGIIWFLLAIPFVIASVIIFVGLNKNAEKSFVEYINEDYQFSLQYPNTWSQRQLDDPITGEIVVFASPEEADADLYIEKVYIAVEYLSSEPTNLEKYSQTVLNRISQAEGNIELYKDFQTTIDNIPARTVVYSRQEGSLQLRQMEAFTIKNNQVYIAIYTAERAKFAKFYPAVEKIIDSWEIQ